MANGRHTRESGIKYAAAPRSIAGVSEYWIIRFADDDGYEC
jgi:hypothetical protein